MDNQIHLSWSEIDTPEAIDKEFLQGYFNNNFKRWATKYYQKRVDYNDQYIGVVEYEIYVKNSDGSATCLGRTTANNFTVTLTNAQSATYIVKSKYSKFAANASSGAQINVKISTVVPTIPDETEDENDPEGEGNNEEQPVTPPIVVDPSVEEEA